MPTGKIARTRSAIRQRLLEEWNGKLKDTTLTHVVEAVSLQGSDAAVVKGRYRLNGVKIMRFENAPEGSFIFRHKRQQGRWMILKAELLRDEAAKEIALVCKALRSSRHTPRLRARRRFPHVKRKKWCSE